MVNGYFCRFGQRPQGRDCAINGHGPDTAFPYRESLAWLREFGGEVGRGFSCSRRAETSVRGGRELGATEFSGATRSVASLVSRSCCGGCSSPCSCRLHGIRSEWVPKIFFTPMTVISLAFPSSLPANPPWHHLSLSVPAPILRCKLLLPRQRLRRDLGRPQVSILAPAPLPRVNVALIDPVSV